MKKIFVLFFILFIISCDKEEKDFYSSLLKNDHHLIEIDSLIFVYKDSLFISRTADIGIWNNKILVTDFYENRVWIFDKHLNLQKIIGGKGNGPGEFTNCPNIFVDDKILWLFESSKKEISQYDSSFQYIQKYKIDEKVIYQPSVPIPLEDKFVLSVAYPYSIAEDEYFKKYKSLVAIDKKKYTILKNFFDWDNIYFDSKYDAYTKENIETFLAKKNDEYFYAQQKASFKITVFDKNLNLIKSFGLKPKYFKEPPQNLKFKDTQRSLEANARFIGSTTKFKGLQYDGNTHYLFVYYLNLYEDFYIKRSLLWGKHFMQVFDEDYNCIFDGEIPGKLAFVDDGKIYILTDEKPEYIKFKIFRLAKN